MEENKETLELLRKIEKNSRMQTYAGYARTVLVLCTGDFDRPETEGGLFLLPEDLMFGILSGLKQKSGLQEKLHKRRDSVKKWMEPASSRPHPYENP